MAQRIILRQKQEGFSSGSLSIVAPAVVFSRLIGVDDDAFSLVLPFVRTDNLDGTSGDEYLTEHLRQRYHQWLLRRMMI